MSSKPYMHNHHSRNQQLSVPKEWKVFISQIVSISQQRQQKFPKKQILNFSQSPKCPKIKQLLLLLPILHKKYQQSCQHFRQMLVILYLLVLKGCVNTHQQLVNIAMLVLQQLLKFRILVICSSSEANLITQVYSYMENWLSLLVPAILLNHSARQKDRKQLKGDKNQNQLFKYSNCKTFVQIIFQINKQQKQQQAISDHLLVIFQCMLVCKIRNHLLGLSLFQFDSIMKRIYTNQKFDLIYQGRGCVTHISNKQKQKMQSQRQLISRNLIEISHLIPARKTDSTWQIIDLQLQLPSYPINDRNIQKKQSKNSTIKAKKVQSNFQIQKWVKQAYDPQNQPQQIKLNLGTIINSMKALQIYKFLCLLEIYGSSPNIEVLNQYIIDEGVLQFFTRFLLGQSLIELASQLSEQQQNNKTQRSSNISLKYSYKNERLMKILQICFLQYGKLENNKQRDLLIEQIKTRKQGFFAYEPKQGQKQNKKGLTQIDWNKDNQSNTDHHRR